MSDCDNDGEVDEEGMIIEAETDDEEAAAQGEEGGAGRVWDETKGRSESETTRGLRIMPLIIWRMEGLRTLWTRDLSEARGRVERSGRAISRSLTKKESGSRALILRKASSVATVHLSESEKRGSSRRVDDRKTSAGAWYRCLPRRRCSGRTRTMSSAIFSPLAVSQSAVTMPTQYGASMSASGTVCVKRTASWMAMERRTSVPRLLSNERKYEQPSPLPTVPDDHASSTDSSQSCALGCIFEETLKQLFHDAFVHHIPTLFLPFGTLSN